MKTKLLFVAVSSFLCASVFAQITVDHTNIAPIGDLIRQANDTLPGFSIFPGPSGTNQIWNFSALHNDKVDSLVFEVPGWTPYSAPFATSDLGIVVNGKQYEYLINNTAGLFLVGAAIHLPDPGQHLLNEFSAPNSKLIQWPASYGMNYTDNYVIAGKAAYNQVPGYDSVKIKNTTNSTVTIDAWGSVQTPLMTFQSLREKRHKFDFDSTWLHKISPSVWIGLTPTIDTVDSYTWWSNSSSAGYPVVTMDQNPNNMKISSVQWLLATPTVQAVVELTNVPGLNVYPNPANDYIDIQMNNLDAISITVIDLSGRIILTAEKPINNLSRLNTQSLGSGMYFLLTEDRKGQRNTRKFNISR